MESSYYLEVQVGSSENKLEIMSFQTLKALPQCHAFSNKFIPLYFIFPKWLFQLGTKFSNAEGFGGHLI